MCISSLPEGLRHRKKPESHKDESQSNLDPFDQVNLIVIIIIIILHTPTQAKSSIVQSIQRFLNKYGFRCINELKLEESTLHDDPGMVLSVNVLHSMSRSLSISSHRVCHGCFVWIYSV